MNMSRVSYEHDIPLSESLCQTMMDSESTVPNQFSDLVRTKLLVAFRPTPIKFTLKLFDRWRSIIFRKSMVFSVDCFGIESLVVRYNPGKSTRHWNNEQWPEASEVATTSSFCLGGVRPQRISEPDIPKEVSPIKEG